MKRLFLLILSFMFLGGAVSSSAFYINNGLQVTETNRGGEFTTSENENLDDVTANAPTNSGYWTDAGNYATSFAGGSGTESDPYLISTPQQLARLAYLINGSSSSSYRSLYYEQTTNLNMSAYWWDAIGYSSSYYFSGKYNGGGFTIAGLYTEAGTTSDYSYQGLFGYVEGSSSTSPAEIHDVGIIDSNIQGYQYIGGIVGRAYSSSTITNCYNTGSVTGSIYVGGIAGYAFSSTITNCYNTGSVTGSSYVGGIAGRVSSSTITNCYNTGSVSGEDDVGGIAGYASSSTSITNCYNTGSVTGPSYVGGIAGRAYSTITNCYNTGSVTGSSYVGGIAGRVSSSTITNCYNTGSVSGEDDVGGIAGYASSSTITNCYWGGNCTLSVAVGSGSATNCGTCTIEEVKSLSWYSDSSKWNSSYPWDFETVWVFMSGENDGYPVLQAFYMVSITFDANGGQGVMDDFKVLIGTSGILPTCTFIRTGYEFAGWATSSTGAVVYADGATYSANANVTLYAKWTAHKYTVKFNGNGSTSGSMSNQTFTYGTAQKLTSNAFKKTGFTFSKWTRNADGTGTSYTNGQSVSNLTSSNGATINLYAQWTARNEAKYDSAGKYWYVENGKIPQTKVTNSTLISNLNKATTNGANYYIAGQTLTAKVYSGKEYCKWNNNWYEVEPIKWRLDASSSQKDGYGTTTDTNAVLAEIVFVGQYSNVYLGSGAGYSTTAVEEFKKNGIDEKYLVDYQNEAYNFGNGTTMYNLYKDYTNMFVASESEIKSVSTTTAIEFSDLAKDIIKSYGGTNVYFTRDLGSNYNNITCFNEVGVDSQRFATDYRGVQFTVRFTEYACVD